jgi:uncharacterized membrane protein YkoI
MSQNTPSDNDDPRDVSRDASHDVSHDDGVHDAPTEQYPRPASEPAGERAPEHVASGPAASEPAKKSVFRRGSTWAIVGGGVVAALVLVGGGAALGAALTHDDGPGLFEGGRAADRGPLGDDDTDDRGPGDGAPGMRDDRGPGAGPGMRDDRGPGAGPGAETGAADAGELTGIIAKAQAADGVTGDVTQIEARRGGAWEVRFETADGGETDVRVDADGTARVVRTETDDDSAPTITLSDATIESIVRAALAEADGTILEIEADDDTTSPYEVRVLLTDGGRMDIDLGADFAVTGTETKG